jgi:hypothetical protein
VVRGGGDRKRTNCDDELCDLWFLLDIGYCSGVQIKKNEMGGACRLCEGQQQGMQDFCAESEGKRQIGRHIGRWGG